MTVFRGHFAHPKPSQGAGSFKLPAAAVSTKQTNKILARVEEQK